MPDPLKLKLIAQRCAVAKLDAELLTINRQRSEREASDLATYVATPEFQQRAAAVEARVRADITRCKSIVLREIANELQLPLDAAAAWIAIHIAAPLGETIGKGFA